MTIIQLPIHSWGYLRDYSVTFHTLSPFHVKISKINTISVRIRKRPSMIRSFDYRNYSASRSRIGRGIMAGTRLRGKKSISNSKVVRLWRHFSRVKQSRDRLTLTNDTHFVQGSRISTAKKREERIVEQKNNETCLAYVTRGSNTSRVQIDATIFMPFR